MTPIRPSAAHVNLAPTRTPAAGVASALRGLALRTPAGAAGRPSSPTGSPTRGAPPPPTPGGRSTPARDATPEAEAGGSEGHEEEPGGLDGPAGEPGLGHGAGDRAESPIVLTSSATSSASDQDSDRAPPLPPTGTGGDGAEYFFDLVEPGLSGSEAGAHSAAEAEDGSEFEASVAASDSDRDRDRDRDAHADLDAGSEVDAGTDDERAQAPRPSEFARQLLRLSLRVGGCHCGGDRHGRSAAQQAEGRSLDEMVSYWRDELGVPDILGIVNRTGKLPRFSRERASSVPWEAILAGVEDPSEAVGGVAPPGRPRLSLERSCVREERKVQVVRSYDIDAVIMPLRSLAAHTSGFNVVYCPSYMRTIAKGWHVRVGPYAIEPQKCAHVYLGRGFHTADFRTYVFFPHMRGPGARAGRHRSRARRRRPLTAENQRFWVDRILLPAVHETADSRTLQRHPRSYDDAVGWARARQKETATGAARAFSELAYPLPTRGAFIEQTPDINALDDLWQAVKRRAARAPPQWRNPQLITVTYGCKDRYSAWAWEHLRDAVREDLRWRFDMRHASLRHTYVDFAYEDIAATPDPGHAAVTLLRRAACNEADLRSLGLERRAQRFNWHATADAGSVRAEPGRKSALSRGGLGYMQAYNTEKSVFASADGSALPFFSEPAFRALGYSQRLLADFQDMKHPAGVDPSTRARALTALKRQIRRLHRTLKSFRRYTTGGFSGRQEFRALHGLFATLGLETDVEYDLQLEEGAHFPYFALRNGDIEAFTRWDTNRWLFAVCAALTPHSDNTPVSLPHDPHRARPPTPPPTGSAPRNGPF